MKIAIAQINPIIGDYEHNLDKIIRYAQKAKEKACDLVVFSELVLTGYPPRDLLEKADFVEANLYCLDRLCASIKGIGVICGFVEKNTEAHGNPLYNSAALFEDGEMLQQIQKRLLPTYDVFDERRYFTPGKDCRAFDYKGSRIALSICEDVWSDKDIFGKRIYPLDPVDLMIQDGADLIINISASPYYADKIAFRQHMLGAIAKKYGVPLIFANQVGGNDSVLFDGSSVAFDKSGRIISAAADFAEDLVVCDPLKGSGHVRPVSTTKTESMLKGLIMGTHDYVTKCGFKKALVGLSGGIDSALTACIAVSALGKENVSTVFMPSAYTSRDSYEDSEKLARNLSVAYRVIPIQDIFEAFLKHLALDFSTATPGIMEQNLQARTRGTILMALSNKEGALVLSTGNKSELAVGYCTLYGDMNGGLSVISDVPKTGVYDLVRFINLKQEIIPERIISKAPSAELKPDQTDQDDLPPYDTLDIILKGYIEELKSPDELAAQGIDPALVDDVVRRVHQNEYKRRQAAPGLKVTSKAFGEGRRYPIAQRYHKHFMSRP